MTFSPTGWPSTTDLVPHPHPPLPDLERAPAHFAADIAAFKKACEDPELWLMTNEPPIARRVLYIDIDAEDIRRWFNERRDEGEEVDRVVFAHVVKACPELWR